MKKSLLVVLLLVLAVAAGIYFYLNKPQRDIASETADFTTTVPGLVGEFSKDATAASHKYADKTIIVSGRVTALDAAAKTLTLDGKLSATFDAPIPQKVASNAQIKIKTRFVGYDDLLEELKTDQSSVQE